MPPLLLEQCRAFADRVEQAVVTLGPAAGPLAALTSRSSRFRMSCEAVARNRGLSRVTIAFLGPRNAGKTTLLSQLIRDPSIRERLPQGVARTASTRRLIWVGPEAPDGLRPDAEEWIDCPAERLPELGVPCQLVDVPGFNDRAEHIRQTAREALDSALIKVLVVEERGLESFDVLAHLEPADGTMLLPVVNQARAAETGEASAFASALAERLPEARILPPLVIPDFEQRDQDRDEVLAGAREALRRRLSEALAQHAGSEVWLEALAQPQLHARLRRFQDEVRQVAQQALPASAEAVTELDAAEAALPEVVLTGLLGPERALTALLRQRLRSILLDSTPALFFPWRLALGIAHLIWGALDRLPLMLLGSVPSWITAGRTALRNARQSASLDELVQQGMRRQLEERTRDQLAPRVRALHESLEADLLRGTGPHRDRSRPPEVQVDGVAALQERSAAAFAEVLEAHASARFTAGLGALTGTAVFWGVFGWPLYALYLEYARAAGGAWEGAGDAFQRFPAGTFTVLGTAALLALLPMGLLLLAFVSWLTRRARLRRCARDLREAHAALFRELTAHRTLAFRVTDEKLAACRFLLDPR
ncbi:MAG: GTPase domain-containing protein [Verrucomicrobiales bacterium]|nr:GTPase domain-containing protein [Verrucomicrobiales bacterium]